MVMHIRAVTEDYIKDLLVRGTREDGRDPSEFRPINLATGIMPNAEGSAQVELGSTKVIAGVKIGVGEPMSDKPDEGNMITSAELLPVASPNYETGPPSPEAIELARVIDRGIRAAGMIDTKGLFIEQGKVWEVFTDIYIINYDGNLFDAGTLAAAAALSTARMPKYEADGDKSNIIREGSLGRLKIANTATSCTFAKIANSVILDPDGNEESCMDERLTIANDENVVRAMQKGLSGAFSTRELDNLMGITFERSKELRKLIENAKA